MGSDKETDDWRMSHNEVGEALYIGKHKTSQALATYFLNSGAVEYPITLNIQFDMMIRSSYTYPYQNYKTI